MGNETTLLISRPRRLVDSPDYHPPVHLGCWTEVETGELKIGCCLCLEGDNFGLKMLIIIIIIMLKRFFKHFSHFSPPSCRETIQDTETLGLNVSLILLTT